MADLSLKLGDGSSQGGPLLQGFQDAVLDDRHRLTLPQMFVKPLRVLAGVTEGDVDVILAPSSAQCLSVFPAPVYWEWMKGLEAAGDEEALSYAAGFCQPETLDRQNRFRINQDLLEVFGLSKVVRVVGSVRRLDLMTPEQWRAKMAEARAAIGRTMKRGGGAGDKPIVGGLGGLI